MVFDLTRVLAHNSSLNEAWAVDEEAPPTTEKDLLRSSKEASITLIGDT